jgi:hypothetical protein
MMNRPLVRFARALVCLPIAIAQNVATHRTTMR